MPAVVSSSFLSSLDHLDIFKINLLSTQTSSASNRGRDKDSQVLPLTAIHRV